MDRIRRCGAFFVRRLSSTLRVSCCLGAAAPPLRPRVINHPSAVQAKLLAPHHNGKRGGGESSP